MASLADVQADGRSIEYAEKQMWLVRCARARRKGLPEPPPPRSVSLQSKWRHSKTTASCVECGKVFEIKKCSLIAARKESRGVRCPPCRADHKLRQARERGRMEKLLRQKEG